MHAIEQVHFVGVGVFESQATDEVEVEKEVENFQKRTWRINLMVASIMVNHRRRPLSKLPTLTITGMRQHVRPLHASLSSRILRTCVQH